MALAHSFYAEIAAVRGDVDEAVRRRREVLAFYGALPDDPFVVAARAYSLAKLAILQGDLSEAEHQYRAATEGFSLLDRPVMRSICLGMVADFDERSGNYAAAARALEAAIETNDSLGLRGFTGSLDARLGWVLLHLGDLARAEAMYERALEGARRLRNAPVIFLALSGMAVLHRARARDGEAARAGTEALELYLAGGPRRFKNRVDHQNDLLTGAATCCSVLSALAAEAGDGERAARLVGHAERLWGDAGGPVPALLADDLARARSTTVAMLGNDGFLAAAELGRSGELGPDLAGSPPPVEVATSR
jgi:tetratricopeptide (TPR) repeat protein